MNGAYFADEKPFSADVNDYEKWIHHSTSVALELVFVGFKVIAKVENLRKYLKNEPF